MANVVKYKMSELPHMFSHYGRQQGEDIRRGNEKINKELTHLNYDLHSGAKADSSDSKKTEKIRKEMSSFVKKRLSEIKHEKLEGKNADRLNIMCDFVITLPDNVTKDKEDEFFKCAYDFLCDRYGKQNVISAWVHKDETTPHMHFSFMPVVKDEDGSERLCCREVITRSELKKFHPDLQKFVEDKMGQSVAILNGATAGGNLEIIELKTRDALIKLAEIEAKTGGLETAQPIIENTLEMIKEITAEFEKLDKALKSKKWFGDDDKIKMEALKNELDNIKKSTDKASKTVNVLVDKLKGLGDNVNKRWEDAFERLDSEVARAQKRIKRTERKLDRREERVAQKEKNIDSEIEKGVKEKLAPLEKNIEKKKATIAALDKEIEHKKKQSAALTTDFFTGQEFLRQAKENQKNFNQIMQEWSDNNESKIHRPAISKG